MAIMNLRSIHSAPFTKCCSFGWMLTRKKAIIKSGIQRDAKGAKVFNGVGYKHPRGSRIGFWKWDMPGLRSAVHIEGSINNNQDKDKGWTVEIAIPWTSLKILAEGDGRALPPLEGDVVADGLFPV